MIRRMLIGLAACALVFSPSLANGGVRLLQPAARDSTGSTAAPPTTVIPREGCVTTECHPGIKQHQHVHGPVLVNACESCHNLTDPATHKFAQVRSRSETCTLCHAIEVTQDATLHSPFVQGECLSCHDPHGSREPAMLRGERYADACKSCHADITGAHDHMHGPASAGACGACHQPHAAKHKKLLIAEGRELCLRCHVRTGLEIENKPVVHEPAKGDCRVCHDPHATDNPAILVEDAQTLCTSCHANIAHTIDHATTQHAAVTTKRSCLNCHSPHASDRSSLLKNDERQLCFECHNQTIDMPDGSKLVNIKEVLEKGKSLHGVIAERNCDVCHEIHGGGHRRLLTNEYPSDLYYPFSENAYALCFSCHDRQMVLLSRSDQVTQFRNGDRNLHYAHVNRDGKGRSCRVCHDSHAASHDRHIRAEIPYGPAGWKLPIKYESLPEGGKCGPGCHQSFEYNRKTPVVYPAGGAEGAWKGENLVPGIRADQPETPDTKKPDPRK